MLPPTAPDGLGSPGGNASRIRVSGAVAVLSQYLATNRESFAAWNLLRAVYWRASNIPAYREATGKLCELHLRARESEAAWQDYEDFLNAGGENVPPTVWLGLCRVAEERGDFERAVSEYEKLAAAYPSERQAPLAQLCAARICLKRLNRPQDALRFHEAASASAVPNLDLEQDIESGIREASEALSQPKSSFGECGRWVEFRILTIASQACLYIATPICFHFQAHVSLVVRVDFDDRAELLAADPDVCYVTDHYLDYNAVLVRLSRVTPDVLRDSLGMAHEFVTAHAARRSLSRNRRKPA